MTSLLLQMTDYFFRFRARVFAPRIVRNWSLGGARANPELAGVDRSRSMADLVIGAWRRYRIRQRWQRDLRALDDRQLRDIGISRLDAEQTIKRLRFWI